MITNIYNAYVFSQLNKLFGCNLDATNIFCVHTKLSAQNITLCYSYHTAVGGCKECEFVVDAVPVSLQLAYKEGTLSFLYDSKLYKLQYTDRFCVITSII